MACLHKKLSLEQIADQVGISHETIYLHERADKAPGGSLCEQLRCQKKRKKRYASWSRDRSGQIALESPLVSDLSTLKPDPKIGHWEGDALIGAAYKQAIVTLMERKSGYALIAKVSNKTSDLVSQTIITKLNPVALLIKALTFDNGKELAEHVRIE